MILRTISLTIISLLINVSSVISEDKILEEYFCDFNKDGIIDTIKIIRIDDSIAPLLTVTINQEDKLITEACPCFLVYDIDLDKRKEIFCVDFSPFIYMYKWRDGEFIKVNNFFTWVLGFILFFISKHNLPFLALFSLCIFFTLIFIRACKNISVTKLYSLIGIVLSLVMLLILLLCTGFVIFWGGIWIPFIELLFLIFIFGSLWHFFNKRWGTVVQKARNDGT
jgi:hypothetical protein